jgi:hypothetical protein
MNAGWILPVAFVCCGADYDEQYAATDVVAQVQYNQPLGQPPATASARIVAQQNQQYTAQPTAQFQNAANNQPTLPPNNASAFGQQPAQPSSQNYQPASSFTQQQQPRASVFSAQPTVNASNQGWNGSAAQQTNVDDPRYTASATNDPRYNAPLLAPPENSAVQQYTNQLNNTASQFNNTLRDAQQQAQQYTQAAQQFGQQAQQLGQTAQAWQQQASQLGQQVQPYLSSLTNNPYAYVPPQQPQPDPAANQYLAANAQTADSQFGRSVLVNNQQNTASSFGQPYAANQPYNNSQPYNTGGTQFTNNQQPTNSSFDNRNQQYQPEQNPNTRLTSGQSAFTNSGQSNVDNGVQDPRLMQTPTNNDPRFSQQDPRAAQDPRTLALEPPLTSTLPNGSNQGTAPGSNGQLSSPYVNVPAPRADGQPNTQTGFGNANTPPNSTTNFANGTKTEVPSLFNNVLPTNNSRFGATTLPGNNQFNATPTTVPNGGTLVELPYMPLGVSLFLLFASIGANFYFGWNFTEYYFRYRKLLVEGEDDDRSRSRDDDRRR